MQLTAHMPPGKGKDEGGGQGMWANRHGMWWARISSAVWAPTTTCRDDAVATILASYYAHDGHHAILLRRDKGSTSLPIDRNGRCSVSNGYHTEDLPTLGIKHGEASVPEWLAAVIRVGLFGRSVEVAAPVIRAGGDVEIGVRLRAVYDELTDKTASARVEHRHQARAVRDGGAQHDRPAIATIDCGRMDR